MLNLYFGVWTRLGFYQKPDPILLKITSWNWTMSLIPVLKPSKIGGQFNPGSKTSMKPLGFDSTQFPKVNSCLGSFLDTWIQNCWFIPDNPVIWPTLVCTLPMLLPSLVNMHSTHSCRFCKYAVNTCNIWRFGHWYSFIRHLC